MEKMSCFFFYCRKTKKRLTVHEVQVFLSFEYVAKQPPILLEQGLILKVSAGHMGSQLLTIFQSITPAVHASVNFAPD